MFSSIEIDFWRFEGIEGIQTIYCQESVKITLFEMLNYGSFMEMNAIIQKHDWWIKILKNNN